MLQSIRRLLGYAGEYRGNMILSVLLSIGSVAAGIFPYFAIQRFVMEMIRPGATESRLMLPALAVGAALILKSLLFAASTTESHKAAYRILHNIRLRLADKLTRLPLGYVLERDSGVIKKVMENDVEELERFLAHNIPETIASAIVPLAVLLYLFFVDWRMAFSFLVLIPFAVLFYWLMMRGSKVKMGKYYQSVDKMNAVVVEYVGGMKEIKAFNQTEGSFARFRDAVNDYRRYVLAWYKSAWPLMSAYFVLIQATTAVVLPAGLYFLAAGSLDLPELVLFLLISISFAAPLIKLAEFADGIILIVNAERNIRAILTEEEQKTAAGAPGAAGHTVVFDNVSFAYDREKVLDAVSFTAAAAKKTAIVGPSGSGKSTIAKLICRFWDASEGKITIGGADVRDLPPKALMDLVSFVFQDTFLFNISIGDNIRIGKPEATAEEVMAAAKKARCHDFIMNTDRGYDTPAGEAGSRLSGGERQRICIARAMLKNAPILILDEATASIDPDCEEQIQEALGVLAKGKTLLVIAHRIRTIMRFDRIVVLRKGKVEASATHEELLCSSGAYRSIFEAYSQTENWRIGAEGGKS
ncbi:MAG: ABC transporter ATP-binding protein [Syntrophaceticus schinkii]|jgi:ATP-binding cassette subfamily B protein IrtA|nr:ABC transporter ATP-binding protein [Syntrophaceticus schinkii]